MTTDLLPLRSYQREAIDAVTRAWAGGMRRPAVVLPCGTGKTVLFSHLASESMGRGEGRVMVVVNRDELCDQSIGKVRSVAPHLSVGKVKAGDDETDADVVVASVQTISRDGRLERLTGSQDRAGAFGSLIVDEVHFAAARSYQKVIGAFPGARMLGVTATLARGDGVGLGDVVDDVVYSRSPLWMISKGYLCDVRGEEVTAEGLDLAGVKRSSGDYQAGALGDAMIESGANKVLAGAYARYASDRAGLVFTPDVASAYDAAEELRKLGITAAVVTGATPREERLRIYEASRLGKIQVIVNCAVLTTGFDAPWISCVVPKATQSQTLWIQMAGRAMRTYPGKREALVLSISGVSGSIRTLIDLEPGAVKFVRPGELLSEAVVREAEEANQKIPAGSSAFELKRREHDLFSSSECVWLRTHGGVLFIPSGDWNTFLWPHGDGTWDVCRAPKRGKWDRLHTGLDLSAAMAWGEAEAEELGGTIARRTASWRKRKQPPSEAQLAMARRLRIEVPEDARKDQVSDLISIAFASQLFDRFMKIA